MGRSAMRLATGSAARGGSTPRLPRSCAKIVHGLLSLVLLSACGVPESDPPPPGPFLGDWTEITRIGELRNSHRVLGAAVVTDTTGSQTRRDEFGGIVMSGLGGRVAVAYRDPFPALAILARRES